MPISSQCYEWVHFSVFILLINRSLFSVSVSCVVTEQYVLSRGVFFLEVFCRFLETKLLFCSDTDNYASGGVHFSYYHYHMQLLKCFKSRPKSPYQRGFSSGQHPTLVEDKSNLRSCVAVGLYKKLCICYCHSLTWEEFGEVRQKLFG